MRLHDLQRFYRIIARLEETIGGTRKLLDCSGRMNWPRRGVYFFQEPGELRSDTGEGLRIVRVGTHALKSGSRTTLWTRLSQHKGQARSRGGNHRGSIFRLLVGAALMRRDGYHCPSWGKCSSAPREVRESEHALERAVSAVISDMPFLWLAIEDEPGPETLRGYIERNAISLLSNHGKPPLDPPAPDWLGQWCDRERVRTSGLWNSNHVDEDYDPAFLDLLEDFAGQMRRP